jgi:hypothetical protein
MPKLKTLLYGSELRPGKQAPSILPVAPYPPQTGPWTRSNNLGYQIRFDLTHGRHTSVLTLPEWGFPEVWTISLGIVPDQVNWPIVDLFDVTALLSLGVGGATQDVEIDWSNGNMVSAPLNALTVSAIAFASGLAPGTLGSVLLQTTVSRGTRPGVSYPTRSYREIVPIPGAADGAFWPIPPFARRLDLYSATDSTNLYNAASYITFYARNDIPAGSIVGRMPTAMLLTQPDGISIPYGAHGVQFHNGSLFPLFIRWMFKIGL